MFAALATIYIVLGILYESFIHPITILSTLPSAGVGAILALMAFHFEFSVIAFIGVILLISIVKKNAIMMIDVALQCGAARRSVAARSDPSRLSSSFSADHDDNGCRSVRRPATGARYWRRRGAPPAARDFHHRRAYHQSGAHTLHHTVVYLQLDRLRIWCKGMGKTGQRAPAAEAWE